MKFATISELMAFLELREGWQAIENWEELSDLEIFRMCIAASIPHGPVSVISEASYREGLGAFQIQAERLTQFAAMHSAIFSECMFDGDLLILDGNGHVAWAFHHEGMYLVFDSRLVI
jgi:hypothetical protein